MEDTKELFFKNLGGGIYEIETYYMNRKKYACCYLIRYKGEIVVVETNTNRTVTFILGTLEKLGLSRSRVKYVIVTHLHLDHAGGAGELMRNLPEAKLVIHPRGARHIINPERLITSVKNIYGEEKFTELYGKIVPVPEERVLSVNDGDVLYFGGRKIYLFDTPGHAKHHIVAFDENTRSVFSGDSFGISYPSFSFENFRMIFPSTAPTQFEPDVAIETYDKIIGLSPSQILLTHYGAFKDVKNAYSQLTEWIRFSVKIANKRYNEGNRDDELEKILLDDLLARFSEKLDKFCSKGLTDDETEFLMNDADLNAKGLTHYIQSIRS